MKKLIEKLELWLASIAPGDILGSGEIKGLQRIIAGIKAEAGKEDLPPADDLPPKKKSPAKPEEQAEEKDWVDDLDDDSDDAAK